MAQSSWSVALVFDDVPADSPREAIEKIVETVGLQGRVWGEARARNGDMTYAFTVSGSDVIGLRPRRRGEKGWTNG